MMNKQTAIYSFIFLGLLLLGAGACTSSRATQQAKSGMVSYEITLDLKEAAQAMAETFGNKANVWFNEQYLRLQKESEVPDDEFFITDLSTGKEMAYVQIRDYKFALIPDPRMLPQTGAVNYLEEEKNIAGFRCKKATASMGSGTMEVYYTKDIPVDYCPYIDLDGFALEYTLVMPFGKVTYRAKEVQLKALPEALVNPPAGFETLTYVEFQQRMEAEMAPSPTPGKSFDFQKTDLQGAPVHLVDYRGKVVVLNFWFTTCPPCKAEIPDLNQLVDQYKGQDVEFIAITFDEAKKVQDFLVKNPFHFRQIANAQDVIKEFEIFLYPTTMVLDKKGEIVNSIMGGNSRITEEVAILIEMAKKN